MISILGGGNLVPFTLRELAELVQGELVGPDCEQLISGAKPLSEAGPGEITYVEGSKQFPQWAASSAAAAVVPLHSPLNSNRAMIRAADALMAFARIVEHFRGLAPLTPDGQIDPTARIHPTALIGPGCTIGAYSVIGEGSILGHNCYLHPQVVIGRRCQLGDHVTLHPQVVLYDETRLGHRVIVHSHSVLGADGFGYRTVQGVHHKVPQLGHVEVGDDVEIGACTTIDRGTFGSTRIGPGTKLDNLIQIGHNCQIGAGNIFAGHVGISGSVTTGAYVVMAGQVGIADHVTIGEGAVLGAKTGVHVDLTGGVRYLGAPAIPIDQELRILSVRQKLPQLRKDLKRALKALGLEESDS